MLAARPGDDEDDEAFLVKDLSDLPEPKIGPQQVPPLWDREDQRRPENNGDKGALDIPQSSKTWDSSSVGLELFAGVTFLLRYSQVRILRH